MSARGDCADGRTSRDHSLLRVRCPSSGAGRLERDAGRGTKRRWSRRTWWCWRIQACRAWLGGSRRQLSVTVNASCSYRAGPEWEGREPGEGRDLLTSRRVSSLREADLESSMHVSWLAIETRSLIRLATRPRLLNPRTLAPLPLLRPSTHRPSFVSSLNLTTTSYGQHRPRTRQTFSRLGLKSSEGAASSRVERRLYRL